MLLEPLPDLKTYRFLTSHYLSILSTLSNSLYERLKLACIDFKEAVEEMRLPSSIDKKGLWSEVDTS